MNLETSTIKARFEKKTFVFKRPGGTSRGILTEKKAWFVYLWNKNNPSIVGTGECSIIPNLSPDYSTDEVYEDKLQEVVDNCSYYLSNSEELRNFPSIYFGLEMALLDFKNGGNRIFFDTPFTHGKKSIPINGLIWMGDVEFMNQQIKEKLRNGYSCIKLKIGAINFKEEYKIIAAVREKYTSDQITLRVDANGAFTPEEAIDKLKQLSQLDIHSIEQPIRQDQIEEMRKLCEKNILPIALDEELIGVYSIKEKVKLLHQIQPDYIILKPSLVGGFSGTKEWIEIAEKYKIGWWITSALESNLGLDAIAQFTSTYPIKMHQGLGTGMLYKKNVSSKLRINNGRVFRSEN